LTTIAYRNGQMAADSQVTAGHTIIPTSVTKIARRKKDGALAAACGHLTFLSAFLAWFEAGEKGEGPPLDEGDRGIIVRGKGKPIEVFENTGWFEYSPEYAAFGSGLEFAMGAMHHGATAYEAIQAAVKHDPGTGGEILVMSHAKG
jgi:ATP-dependent protease HslVU (ClpYQ) peptidase subunit